MKKHQRAVTTLTIASLILGVSLFMAGSAQAQMRPNPTPLPDVTINAQCKGDRAVFEIRNGAREWRDMGEIIVLSEQERRIVSRRKMRFASNQRATYRVPLIGRSAAEGPLRIVLMSGGDVKKPIAHARLDCAQS